MKYLVTIKYPSGYRHCREIEAGSVEAAWREAERIRLERDDKGFSHFGGPVCRIESVEPVGYEPRRSQR